MKHGYAISGSGGGIGFPAGALEIATQKNIPDLLVGVSGGSIASIMTAVGKLSRMNHILSYIIDSDIANKRLFRYLRRYAAHLIGIDDPQMGLYDNSPLRGLLYDELIGQTVHIDVTSIAVNAKTNALAYWSVPRGTKIMFRNMI